MFQKVLIANRGEIAIRIAATLQQMGIRVAAVYSDADANALHLLSAEEVYRLCGESAAKSYLNIEQIVGLALSHGVDAIHPGYGFLSENADFAQACSDAGVTFIGPSPQALRAAGDKILAKQAAAQVGVPIVPSWSGEVADSRRVAHEAAQIGFPLLVKAAAGGGGKGMRVVQKERELQDALGAAQREAAAAFGDDRVFLEKYIPRPRHVEVQVFGDTHGNIVHMYERECSIQRRHQKIVEESPSSALGPELRAALCEAAVRVARSIGYTNAGTVEFLLDESGRFYFLEVNARLQVEHPVTELLLRRDLVELQVAAARGARLPFQQDELRPEEHVLECRVYAEDANAGFLPATGTIEHFVPPVGQGIRVDSGVVTGSSVSVHFDPLLAKLIVQGRTREQAIEKMLWALRRFVIMGVTTNIEFLQRLIDHPEFRAGNLHTHFLEEHSSALSCRKSSSEEALIIAALASHRAGVRHAAALQRDSADDFAAMPTDPWQVAGAWRMLQ